MTPSTLLSEETLIDPARILSALSDPARLRIVNLIRHGEDVCNCLIEPITGYLPSKISRHLSLLKQAGLLSERREGTFRYYRLKEAGSPVHEALLHLLAEICESDPLLKQDREAFDRDCPC
ncbi:metalloregulator ArsR/SmtB family transcription factor [Verrucomicrobiales bacterium BCK34]|nr:metalloregulator ArsR/SmtB family transcription factor [Verrucomicrobiales bacterium BCK34]